MEEPKAKLPLNQNQINILHLFEACLTLRTNVDIFNASQGQVAAQGSSANLVAFNQTLAVLYQLKLNATKEEYERLLNNSNFALFDSTLLQAPMEIREKPKSQIILLDH
jgi:hypothetical protein